MKKYVSEFIGTAVLVLFGCGSATLGGSTLGILGIAMAFGLSIVAMAYVIGKVSGCHINPAVSLAMLIDGRMSVKDFICYVVAQVLGAILGIGILYFFITSLGLSPTEIGLGANGYSDDFGVFGALLTEIILTFVFVFTVLGVTADESKSSVAGIVIGLTLAFVHIMGIPLTGTSVNPARSLAPALFLGGEALQQVWVFIFAPLVGSALAAVVYKFIIKENN